VTIIITTVQTPAQHPPAGCSGDCDAGQRDCTCAHAVIGMWDDEHAHPVRTAALVAAAISIAVLVSHLWPWGFAA
jgi:hypothetical protein